MLPNMFMAPMLVARLIFCDRSPTSARLAGTIIAPPTPVMAKTVSTVFSVVVSPIAIIPRP